MFAERLKELREDHNMLQKDLANRLNVRNATISAWENKISEPDIDTIILLSNIFGVTTDYLLGLDENTSRPYPPKNYQFKKETITIELTEEQINKILNKLV
jgi:transcriptional regulator with XRE-family HTH domain